MLGTLFSHCDLGHEDRSRFHYKTTQCVARKWSKLAGHLRMKPFNILVFSLVLYMSSKASPVSFIDCGSSGVVVKAVDLEPCNSDPCVVYKGQPSSFVITFDAEKDIEPKYFRLYSRVAGTLGEAVIPDNDACKRITPACPLNPGGEYRFTYNERINWNIPNEAKGNALHELFKMHMGLNCEVQNLINGRGVI
ncbi:hypothetical protein CRM22_004884 [Opisthorchis felineus]|uniref:MD-2-related lipid-recognition domain-containing protein n=1 Tax=Opisthorchis felineus TaxID=147828 RepID=A0A4S2LV21_OPIFE|nr:hypothetical protein CRM22_004884 [Opisthorchis felineus]